MRTLCHNRTRKFNLRKLKTLTFIKIFSPESARDSAAFSSPPVLLYPSNIAHSVLRRQLNYFVVPSAFYPGLFAETHRDSIPVASRELIR
ncbi:hypothetical protein DDT52_04950 [Brenneria roseae subsp. roseae]|nr:hypothetical protein DDT52_04950 [Brenneria roseae subsp. roseae]